MEQLGFSPEARRRAREWAEDADWVRYGRYGLDTGYMECVGDLLDHPAVRSMERYMQHGTTTCLDHCLRVSYLTYRICKNRGWDYRSAARAALLHDLFLYDWHTHARETGERFHGFTHPKHALCNANRYFTLTEKEQDMILRHMWPLTPVPPKSREGFCLVWADKFCSTAETAAGLRDWILEKAGVRHDVLGKTI